MRIREEKTQERENVTYIERIGIPKIIGLHKKNKEDISLRQLVNGKGKVNKDSEEEMVEML